MSCKGNRSLGIKPGDLFLVCLISDNHMERLFLVLVIRENVYCLLYFLKISLLFVQMEYLKI